VLGYNASHFPDLATTLGSFKMPDAVYIKGTFWVPVTLLGTHYLENIYVPMSTAWTACALLVLSFLPSGEFE
jgi:hypothetical protein